MQCFSEFLKEKKNLVGCFFLKELDLLNEDTNVYKLIGPVLVKQDLAEANANVRKRIEYITAELYALLGFLMFVFRKTLTITVDELLVMVVY